MARRHNPVRPVRYFHGTSDENATAAVYDGVLRALPYDGKYEDEEDDLTPLPGLVYMTSDLREAYDYAYSHDEWAAIVEVEPIEPCQPDEDTIGEAVRNALLADRGQRPGTKAS